MDTIYEILTFYPLFSLLQTAFMVWMLVDAYRRGAEWFWFFVILFVPAVGSWVYFFAVKLPSGDFRNVNVGGLVRRGPPLSRRANAHAGQSP
jgi:phosphoglycerol transferase MdoB-like AlkP superfamily enzyme